MTLEEVIKQRLAEATQAMESKNTVVVAEQKTEVVQEKKEETVAPAEVVAPVAEAVISKETKKEVDPEEVGKTEEVDLTPKKKKEVCKESTTSSQVASLLEAEGLSEDFKVQAVTIFEAAVTDRVLQIEESLKEEFDTQIAEAKKEMQSDIDGFLSEAIQQWKAENEVAIKANFKSQLAESFMDGMKALMLEHNVTIPEGKEDALEVALSEVEKLNESVSAKEAEKLELMEQINELKAEQILESFKEKMTQTEFDRFVQLTESIKFTDEAQYTKQLNIVKENFGIVKEKATVVTESVTEPVKEAVTQVITESNSHINAYASYLTKQKR